MYDALRSAFKRTVGLFRGRRLDSDLDAEVRLHLEMLEHEYVNRGMTPQAARAAARRSFGGVEQMKERYRDRRSIPMIETTLQDVRYAARTLRKSPVFTIVAVLSIALGIGANTAVFTLLDQVLIRSLPVKDPRQLVLLTAAGEQYGDGRGEGDELSYPRFADLRDHNDVFSDVCARVSQPLQATFGGRTERIIVEQVSGTYFRTLGVVAQRGRVFGPEEDVDRPAASVSAATAESSGHAVVVLSHAYWKTRFASDPDIIGKPIAVNTFPMTIVGVAQEGFDGLTLGTATQVFVPLAMRPLLPEKDALANRRLRWLNVFARLRPGVTPEQAQARLQPFYASQLRMEVNEPAFTRASPQTKAAFLRGTLSVAPAGAGKSRLRVTLARPLWILMTIVACVLLISCANVANLLLARASTRQREIALRLALGATRWRIVRQLLIESLVLAVLGGAAGLAIAVWGSNLLLEFFRDPDSVLTVSASPDLRILGFNLALSLLTGILFGLMPARRSTSPALAPTLKNEAGSVIGGGSARLRKTLVAAQVALSLLLLIGAGLFIRSLHNLMTLDTGIDSTRLLSFNLSPGLSGYEDERGRQFRAALLDRIRATPGIEAAAYGARRLLEGGSWNNFITVEGFDRGTGPAPFALNNAVSPGYFAALKMRILAGRDFDTRDLQPNPPDRPARFIAIANQTFVNRYLKGDGLGRHVGIGADPGTPTPIEIVGVVSDAKYTSLRETPKPQLFFPYVGGDRLIMYVRTANDPAPMFQTLQRLLQEMDRDVVPYAMQTFDARIDRSLTTERLVSGLSTVFGVLATLLAMIGLYGVMAYGVTRRTREIGVRMAMGAQTREVAWLVLREALALVAIGVAIGLPAALFASRYIESQLYEVSPLDIPVLAAAVAGLTAMATLAAFIPAKRAARVNPVIALRYD